MSIENAVVTAATHMLMVKRDSPETVAAYLSLWAGDLRTIDNADVSRTLEARFAAAAAERKAHKQLRLVGTGSSAQQ